MNVNAFLQKDYENETAFRPKKTNPNKPNSNPILSAVGGFRKPKSLAKKTGHTRLAGVLKIVCKNAPFGYTHPDCRATAGFDQTRAIHVAWKGFGDGGK
jgi:hypothetical protein